MLTFLISAFLQTASAAPLDRTKLAKTMLAELETRFDLFYTDCGRYPSTEEGLMALIEPVANCGTNVNMSNWGPDPYISQLSSDPWGRPWIYNSANPKNFVLKSLGADHHEGGLGQDADIVYDSDQPRTQPATK